MTYDTNTREGKTFLGNKNKKEVHDLRKEDKRPNGCQVDEFLNTGHGVGFIPDTLKQAAEDGYDNCDKCIGSSQW